MRVIAGTFKGRNIPVIKNFSGRPTTDFAREGLFNVLQNIIDLNGAEILDLFSGTGAFSVECYSRGASRVNCVEMSATHARGIRELFRHFNMENASIQLSDVKKYLQNASEKFDLVFADPPYNWAELALLPDMVLQQGLLKPNGLLIIEHSRENNFSSHPSFKQHRHYSNVHFSFFAPSQS